MSTVPYAVFARMNADGTVVGAYAQTLTITNSREYEDPQVPLADATHPAFADFASQFSAAAVAQRDALMQEKQTLSEERDELLVGKGTLEEQVAQLNTELEALSLDRDTLLANYQSLTAERDAFASQNDDLAAQVLDLQGQLDALLNPPANPRHLAPFVFLGLFRDEEVYAALSSTDPLVVVGLAKLQTIITFVDLDLPDTVNLVNYLERIRIIEAGRAAQILAGEPYEQ